MLGPFYVEEGARAAERRGHRRPARGYAAHVTGSVASAAEGRSPPRSTSGTPTTTGAYDVQQLDALGGLAGRAQFRTDRQGRFTSGPSCRPGTRSPADGPVGEMLNATSRHPNRPAHVHFMIAAPGHETLITPVFAANSPWLDSDAVFGVKTSLIAEFAEHPAGTAPEGGGRWSGPTATSPTISA